MNIRFMAIHDPKTIFTMQPKPKNVSLHISENLIDKGGAVQSTTEPSKPASLATDGDTATCTETTLEDAAWWMTSLSRHGNLHSVVLKTGIAFLCRSCFSTILFNSQVLTNRPIPQCRKKVKIP